MSDAEKVVAQENKPAGDKAPRRRTLDWDKAEAKLREVEEHYLSAMGLPGVNTAKFFTQTLPPIRGSWNSGERTTRLYRAIMRLK